MVSVLLIVDLTPRDVPSLAGRGPDILPLLVGQTRFWTIPIAFSSYKGACIH